MELEALRQIADGIPDLGRGGRSVKDQLTLAAFSVKSRRTIIDIAPFFGSTTVYAALGARMSGNDVVIQSYDLWESNGGYVEKAQRHLGLTLDHDLDLMPMWEQNITQFRSKRCEITGRKCNILSVEYSGSKIGLYIDDICNDKQKNDYAIKAFSPHFIPNETLLFIMDYGFHERDNKSLKYQKDFFLANSDIFYHIANPSKSMCAVFLYLGGKIKYIEGDYE